MPSTTVADFLLSRLREWSVGQVFGYPGDGINGLLAEWERADDQPQFVQARHEEMAAFEAVGFAKFSGQVGVCAATSGPGAIHLLNGLYDAKLDHAPVVAIVGPTERSAIGGSYQQEVDCTVAVTQRGVPREGEHAQLRMNIDPGNERSSALNEGPGWFTADGGDELGGDDGPAVDSVAELAFQDGLFRCGA